MKKIRLLLFPLGWIYGTITYIRNLLFDLGIFKTFHIPGKSIVIGNLSVGGTGKTPHTAFLAGFLIEEGYKTAILSRGYGRKTKGFILASETTGSSEIGDEPLTYYRNFPEAAVAVCEKRKEGIQRLQAILHTDVFLLDDAFQHRAVTAEMNILLTDYSHPYFKDLMLPAGDLREWACGKKRADIVIVTKCPSLENETIKNRYRNSLGFPSENIYFSSIVYGALKAFGPEENPAVEKALLVTGIANPGPLEEYLSARFELTSLNYSDHYNFSEEDIEKIHKKFDTFASAKNGIIITTEKDFVRLMHPSLKQKVLQRPWFYQSISVKIDREEDLKNKIRNYVRAI